MLQPSTSVLSDLSHPSTVYLPFKIPPHLPWETVAHLDIGLVNEISVGGRYRRPRESRPTIGTVVFVQLRQASSIINTFEILCQTSESVDGATSLNRNGSSSHFLGSLPGRSHGKSRVGFWHPRSLTRCSIYVCDIRVLVGIFC